MKGKLISNIKQLPALLKKIQGTILILGGVDAGKSSLVEYICEHLSGSRKIGLISADLGQSLIGLPTCFSYARVTNDNIRELEPEKMIFVGATSPRGSFLKVIASFHQLLRYSSARCRKTVVDTDGLVQDHAGKEYKIAMIKMIDEGVVIALQKEDELAHIIRILEYESSVPVLLLQSADDTEIKSQHDRSDYRASKLKLYFQNKVEAEYKIEFDRITGGGFGVGKIMDTAGMEVISKYMQTRVLYGEFGKYELSVIVEHEVDEGAIERVSNDFSLRRVTVHSIVNFPNMLVGFNDKEGFTTVLGVIKEIDIPGRRCSVYLPRKTDLSSLTCVIGKERVEI